MSVSGAAYAWALRLPRQVAKRRRSWASVSHLSQGLPRGGIWGTRPSVSPRAFPPPPLWERRAPDVECCCDKEHLCGKLAPRAEGDGGNRPPGSSRLTRGNTTCRRRWSIVEILNLGADGRGQGGVFPGNSGEHRRSRGLQRAHYRPLLAMRATCEYCGAAG